MLSTRLISTHHHSTWHTIIVAIKSTQLKLANLLLICNLLIEFDATGKAVNSLFHVVVLES